MRVRSEVPHTVSPQRLGQPAYGASPSPGASSSETGQTAAPACRSDESGFGDQTRREPGVDKDRETIADRRPPAAVQYRSRNGPSWTKHFTTINRSVVRKCATRR